MIRARVDHRVDGMSVDRHRHADFAVRHRHGNDRHDRVRPIGDLVGVGAAGRGEKVELPAAEIEIDIVLGKKTRGQKPVIGLRLSQIPVVGDQEYHIVHRGSADGEIGDADARLKVRGGYAASDVIHGGMELKSPYSSRTAR